MKGSWRARCLAVKAHCMVDAPPKSGCCRSITLTQRNFFLTQSRRIWFVITRLLAIDVRQPFSKWWCNDPIARERTDIDVIAADSLSKQILIGECKWRNSFHETEAVERLRGRAGLIRGYLPETARFVLFSKNEVGESIRNRYREDERMSFVSVDDMYAG